jgi:branched-chain amino acid transport system permease protein
MDLFFEALLNGASLGMAYALVAIGLTIIWGVMEVVNFAHWSSYLFANHKKSTQK